MERCSAKRPAAKGVPGGPARRTSRVVRSALGSDEELLGGKR
jgi:hypothetical protein